MLTRPDDRRSLIRMARGLEFLVFDELHTYRGRQGADVALLIRRVKDACEAENVQCVGTSATMATEGTSQQRRKAVADVAFQVFGTPVAEENVIGETLIRATAEDAGPVTPARIAAPAAPADYGDLVRDPLASWIETAFGLDRDDEGKLARRAPTTVQRAARDLAAQTGADEDQCEKAIQRTLQAGSRARDPHSGRPLFAFRLHQFLSKGDTVYVTLEGENTRHITRDYQVEQPGSGGKVLLPLAFCRECGQEYLVTWRRDRSGMVTYLARRDATVADEDGGGRAAYSDGYLYVSSDLPWPRDTETVVADRRVPESWLEVNDRTGKRPGPADRPPVPPGTGHRGRLRPRGASGRRHRGGVHPGRVPVLPALRRLLRAAARQRLRQAGHPRPGGPVVGHDADLHVDRPLAAGHPRGRARRQRAQAPHLRRQPAGRGAAGRALQRLHRGHHGPRRALPGRRQGGGRRRGGPVLRRHPRQGHPRARPRPRTTTPRTPARTRRCAGAPKPRCATW